MACLNEFRLVLRQNNLKMSESHVTEEANHVSAAYHELLARANALSDAFSRVGGKYKVTVFRDVLECRLYLQIENGKICLFFKMLVPIPLTHADQRASPFLYGSRTETRTSFCNETAKFKTFRTGTILNKWGRVFKGGLIFAFN